MEFGFTECGVTSKMTEDRNGTHHIIFSVELTRIREEEQVIFTGADKIRNFSCRINGVVAKLTSSYLAGNEVTEVNEVIEVSANESYHSSNESLRQPT